MDRNETQQIPVVIGVSGHRNIRPQDEAVLFAAVKEQLARLRALCPHSPLRMLSSLAEGADLLCAEAADELGIPLLAVLPREQADYEKDFSPEARLRFSRTCSRAEQVFVAPRTEEATSLMSVRDDQFRQAGIYVVSHCHVLLALWDGQPGPMGACGTAAAVDFALHGDYAPATGVSLRSGANEAVLHIVAPRTETAPEPAGTVHVLGNWEAVRDVLRKTDDFNRHAAAAPVKGNSRLPPGAAGDAVLERMERVSRTAGTLSRFFAKRYRTALALLAVSGAMLTFAFLMYDEARAIWMILVCGLLLLSAWLCKRWATRSDSHRRYLEFRALAECLRVQTYLRYAGSRVRTAQLLSWSQQEDTAWVLDALFALEIGPAPAQAHDIRECWVEAQQHYHEKKGLQSRKSLDASERVVNIALMISVGLYLAAVLFELLCGGLFFRPVLAVENVEYYRTILKILLGTISAVTLFVANYYGRLSLPRTVSDHHKMARFYARMAEQLSRRGQTEALLTVLAREELIENGNWCSYQRDNKPDISI